MEDKLEEALKTTRTWLSNGYEAEGATRKIVIQENDDIEERGMVVAEARVGDALYATSRRDAELHPSIGSALVNLSECLQNVKAARLRPVR